MKVAKAKAALHPSSGDVDSGQSNLLESPHPISFAYSFIQIMCTLSYDLCQALEL